jgi:hypothetical protein
MRRQSHLTFRDAEDIRARYAAGSISQQMLADEYGVSQRLISGIVRSKYLVEESRSCEACHEVLDWVAPNQVRCAPCAKALIDFKTMLRNALDKADRVAAVWAGPSKKCPHCGAEFRTVQTKAAYCSPACSQAAHNATRKAQWKVRDGGVVVERVSRAYIVDRDKSRCHLCGKTCREGDIHLDHLVPLSRGGDHSSANLRVACAACNLSKRADARGEQLLLIG